MNIYVLTPLVSVVKKSLALCFDEDTASLYVGSVCRATCSLHLKNDLIINSNEITKDMCFDSNIILYSVLKEK